MAVTNISTSSGHQLTSHFSELSWKQILQLQLSSHDYSPSEYLDYNLLKTRQ